MKFLRSKSLRELGVYLLVAMCLIYFAEYFIIRQHINTLDEVEQKLDFTRSVQISGQQISWLVQKHSAENDLAVEVEAKFVQQDHRLDVLGNGGRVERTDIILKPLSRLTRISYDNLMLYWADYKAAARRLIQPSLPETSAAPVASSPAVSDSLAMDTATVVPAAQMIPGARASNDRLVEESLALTLSKWYDNVFQDIEAEVAQRKASLHSWVISIIIFDIILLAAVFFAFIRYVLTPLRRLTTSVEHNEQISDYVPNEIGELTGRINGILENLKDATDFVTAIGQGNLDIDYKATLDSGYAHGNNRLADSLIDMQRKLKSLNEDERKRQWANEGLAKFVDILRASNDNINVLGDRIIAALSQYTRSNQGALYILNDENEYDKHLQLISLFAFDIKKHETRKIKLGEGLLGQTFLERETNYYTDFPDEYVRITSGLGDANPRSILIVPLKVDTQVYGIVELASFHAYQPHEIAFVEKLGETIASTIGSVRAAEKNKQLIEQFQTQNEQMRAQEEEMRQNMEELQATQEEVARKERSYIHRIEELENQTVDTTALTALEKSNTSLLQREKLLQEKIASLENQLKQKPVREDDWKVAEELSKALKTNLEALEITQQALAEKASRH